MGVGVRGDWEKGEEGGGGGQVEGKGFKEDGKSGRNKGGERVLRVIGEGAVKELREKRRLLIRKKEQ